MLLLKRSSISETKEERSLGVTKCLKFKKKEKLAGQKENDAAESCRRIDSSTQVGRWEEVEVQCSEAVGRSRFEISLKFIEIYIYIYICIHLNHVAVIHFLQKRLHVRENHD